MLKCVLKKKCNPGPFIHRVVNAIQKTWENPHDIIKMWGGKLYLKKNEISSQILFRMVSFSFSWILLVFWNIICIKFFMHDYRSSNCLIFMQKITFFKPIQVLSLSFTKEAICFFKRFEIE